MLAQTKIVFWTVLVLNVISPFSEGLTTYKYNVYYTKNGQQSEYWGQLMVLSKFAVGLCQRMSAAYLGIAIYKIRNMLS
jgi:hypothetical protein